MFMKKIYKVFIEIPLGTKNNKFEKSPNGTGVVLDFVFKNLVWPFNYGEIEGTLGGDGDCLDAIIFSTKPLKQCSVVKCVAFGVLLTLDRGEVDDKILMVPVGDGLALKYKDIKNLSINERQMLKNLYKKIARQKKKTIKIIGFKNKNFAETLIQNSTRID